MNYNGKIRLTANWIEDPTINKFTIELDLYDKKIISNWELFGSFNLYEINPKPFILSRDGVFLFGLNDPSQWITNLRDKEIFIGSIFQIWYNNTDIGNYNIVKISIPGLKVR